MNVTLVVAAICLLTWGVLVFVLAVPSGWVHAPLAIGCILVARGIVLTRRRA